MYKNLFVKSWKDLKENLVLFVPDLIFFIFMVIFGLILIILAGLFPVLKQIPINAEPDVLKEFILSLFQNTNFIFKFILSLIIFVVATFFVGTFFFATKLGMIKDVASRKKAILSKGFGYGRKFFWKIIGLKILVFLIFLAFGIAAFLIFGLSLSLKFKILSIILGAAIFLGLILLILALFFRYPILFFKNQSLIATIKSSFNFFKRNSKYVVLIFLIILATNFIVSLFFGLLNQIPFIGIFTSVINTIASWAISIWALLFVFNAYKKS